MVCIQAASFFFAIFGLKGISDRRTLAGVGFFVGVARLGEYILGRFDAGKGW